MRVRTVYAIGVRTVALVMLAFAALSARAGPPFRTDDPAAVEYRHAEFYFSEQTLTADGRTGVLPAFEFNYGVHENVQAHLVAPYAFSTAHRPRDGPRVR